LAYHIHIPDREQAYLDALPLSPRAKEIVDRFIERFISNVSDEFRLTPENRPYPDRPIFRVQHILLDRWGDNRLHSIDFYIQDDKAAFGVLLIVFIECF
jgi:hypothetical protein